MFLKEHFDVPDCRYIFICNMNKYNLVTELAVIWEVEWEELRFVRELEVPRWDLCRPFGTHFSLLCLPSAYALG
jgi:hypothetical protein